MDLARGGDLHNKIFDELNISIKKGPKTSGEVIVEMLSYSWNHQENPWTVVLEAWESEVGGVSP